MPQRLAKATILLSTVVAGFSLPIANGSIRDYLDYRASARAAQTASEQGLYSSLERDAGRIALGSGALELGALYAGALAYCRVRRSLRQQTNK